MKKISSKSIHFFTYFFTAFLVILIFNFCAEKKPTEPTPSAGNTVLKKDANVTTQKDSTKKISIITGGDKNKDKKGGGGIVPNAPSQCQKVVYIWQLDHYEVVQGKIVGILPRLDAWTNSTKLHMLKDTLGFGYMQTEELYINNCLQAGYTPQTLMIGGLALTDNDYQRLIPLYPGYLAYYTDEPVSNQGVSCFNTGQKLQEIRYFMNGNGCGSSNLVVGETISELWGWEYYSQCVVTSANILMCTRYYIARAYPPYPDPDQRDIWTEWKSIYPSKFNWTWISFDQDYSEFDNLIGHASNLGLPGIWLYEWEDGISPTLERSRLESFSLFAWKWGYLNRIERKWVYTYQCLNQDPCDCDPNSPSGWIIVDKYPTYETRIRTY